MRRRKTEEKPEGLDRWLLTYADMITLLMAFFIMVYSMSVLNMSKFRQAAISIRSGFGGLVPGQGRTVLRSTGIFESKPSPISGDTAGVSWSVLKPLVEFIDKDSRWAVTGSESQSVGRTPVTIGEDERGIVITLSSDKLLFDPGSADVKPEALPYLHRIAQMLHKIKNQVRIEGHTCNLPSRGPRFKTNWELSTARATNVLRLLTECEKLPPERFSAAGYGSVRPVAPNNSEANRSKNRRVEIIVVRPEIARAITPKGLTRRIAEPNGVVIRRRLD